jgi:hypothetical protein
VGDRPAYRISVARGDTGRSSLLFPAAVAVIDAGLGVILRLTYYIGGTAVKPTSAERRCSAMNSAASPPPAG